MLRTNDGVKTTGARSVMSASLVKTLPQWGSQRCGWVLNGTANITMLVSTFHSNYATSMNRRDGHRKLYNLFFINENSVNKNDPINPMGLQSYFLKKNSDFLHFRRKYDFFITSARDNRKPYGFIGFSCVRWYPPKTSTGTFYIILYITTTRSQYHNGIKTFISLYVVVILRQNMPTKTVQTYRHTCRCGHTWDSDKKHPKVCPKCKSYDWDKVKE